MRSRTPAVALQAATLAFWTSYTMVRPLLAPYAATLGATPMLTGVVVAAQAVPGALLALPGGAIADRFGNRTTTASGAATMVVGGALMTASSSIAPLIVAQALVGGGGILVWVAIQRAVITPVDGDLSRAARDRVIAVNSMYVSAGLVLGPLVGGWTAELFGYGRSFAVFTMLTTALLPVAATMADVRAAEVTAEGERSAGFSGVRRLAVSPGMSATLLASFAVLYLLEFRTSFHPLYFDDIGLAPGRIGVIVATSAAFGVVARPALPYLTRRFGDAAILATCLAVGALGVGAVSLTRSIAVILALAALSGIALGLGQPFMLALVANFTSREERGVGVGLRMVANRTAQWVCPLVLGALLAVFPYSSAFILGASIALALAVFATRRLRRATAP